MKSKQSQFLNVIIFVPALYADAIAILWLLRKQHYAVVRWSWIVSPLLLALVMSCFIQSQKRFTSLGMSLLSAALHLPALVAAGFGTLTFVVVVIIHLI